MRHVYQQGPARRTVLRAGAAAGTGREAAPANNAAARDSGKAALISCS